MRLLGTLLAPDLNAQPQVQGLDLFTDRCRFTDDTAMTVAVAKALLECKGDYTELSDHTVRCMQEIGRKYPNAGVRTDILPLAPP